MVGRRFWLMFFAVLVGLVFSEGTYVLAPCCWRGSPAVTPTAPSVKSQAKYVQSSVSTEPHKVDAERKEVVASTKASEMTVVASPTSIVDATMVVVQLKQDVTYGKDSKSSTGSKEAVNAEEYHGPADAKEVMYRCVKTDTVSNDKADAAFFSLLRFSDGSMGFYVTYGRQATVIDSARVRSVTRKPLPDGVFFLPLAMMLNTRHLVAVLHDSNLAGRDQVLCVYDIVSSCRVMSFEDKFALEDRAIPSKQLERICALTVCPSGNIITGSPMGVIKVWNAKDITQALTSKKPCICIQTIEACTSPFFTSTVLSADGKQREYSVGEELLCSITALSDTYVAYGLYDGTIKILNLENGEKKTLGTCHHGAVTALATISDGFFASGSSDKMIKIWQMTKDRNITCTQVLQGHREGISSLVARPIKSGYELVSLAIDGEIKFWR